MIGKETIYTLYYEWEDVPQFFYVGRTERQPKIRLGEHRRAVHDSNHQEDVYKFIRQRLEPNGIRVWDMMILDSGSDDPDLHEDFYLVSMIRSGHELKNMKRGDQHKIAELVAVAGSEYTIDTVAEFRTVRSKIRDQEQRRSEELRREVLGQTPSPRYPDLSAFLGQITENFREKSAENIKKRQKREQKKIASIIERDQWLKSQRGLFGK